MNDPRKYSAAAARNRDVILSVLKTKFPATGTILEIASGSGEHIVHFAKYCPGLSFQPTDPSQQALASIAAWTLEASVPNVRQPIALDVSQTEWQAQWVDEQAGTSIDGLFCSNMIHIAPWEACTGLITGAGKLLRTHAPLIFYGPFFRTGTDAAPGNVAFDQDLRLRNPQWGIRHLEALADVANDSGFLAPEVTEMPSNNLCVAFRRGPLFDQ